MSCRDGDSKRSPPPTASGPIQRVRHPAPTPRPPVIQAPRARRGRCPIGHRLRHPVFQDGHARTVQPATDRLHHARTEVRSAIPGSHRGPASGRDAPAFGLPIRENGWPTPSPALHHLQLAHPHVDVLEGRTPFGFRNRQGKSRINAVWTRHAECPCCICRHGQATRPGHHHRTGQLGRGRWLRTWPSTVVDEATCPTLGPYAAYKSTAHSGIKKDFHGRECRGIGQAERQFVQ